MSTFHPDDEFFDKLKEAIDGIANVITDYKKNDQAVTSLAEQHAKGSGAAPEQMDAQIFAHKKSIKKAIAERAKESAQPPQAGQPNNTGPNGIGQAMPASSVPPQMQQVVAKPPLDPQANPGSVQRSYGPPAPPMA